ncbi:MAG TPA: hypothetical protein VJP88_01130, partial [Caulobacteraceae bacterium]|nr:hypothetical protein [Caulobacteraceae bacterium]
MLKSSFRSLCAVLALGAALIAPQALAQGSGSAPAPGAASNPAVVGAPPPSSSSAPASDANALPATAEPEFWRMAPIPNPEDMPTAERHRIYGDRYDAPRHERQLGRHHHHRLRH